MTVEFCRPAGRAPPKSWARSRTCRLRSIALGVVLAPALILLWIGFGLAVIGAGLLLAGIAGRQVRAARGADQPRAGGDVRDGHRGDGVDPAGCLPPDRNADRRCARCRHPHRALAIGRLRGHISWPGSGSVTRVLQQRRPAVSRERPYLAAVIGLLILQALSLLPVLGIVSALGRACSGSGPSCSLPGAPCARGRHAGGRCRGDTCPDDELRRTVGARAGSSWPERRHASPRSRGFRR